jgi:hypothetical protein
MYKIITVLLISTFSFSTLADAPLDSPDVVAKIESITDSRIDIYQEKIYKKHAQNIETKSKKMIEDTMIEMKTMK